MGEFEVGTRCVRGPDWQWGDQDGGPGHVGTLVLLGHSSNPGCLPGTVMMLWDNGTVQNYRAGFSNAYDLRVLDNSPCGIFHNSVKCDGCGKCGIFGFRWSCATCPNVDLCSRCYNLKFHDVNHEFIRHQSPCVPGVRVPCRSASSQTEIFGAFRGAIVMRGRDWQWGDQDGGKGSQGYVNEILNKDDQTGNSVASVTWPDRKVNLYRLGHKAKVDVCCISPASGGKVYLAHLPLLGKPSNAGRTFIVGQTVEVFVDIETLKKLQIGHGEFRDEMAEVIGRRGKVHRLTEKGDVRIQFQGNPAKDHRWTLNPLALRIVSGHSIGDRVTITSDHALIAKYHQNHAALNGFSGCTGTITHIHSENSVVVDFGGGRVGAVHSGIILKPKQQDECHNINTKFIKGAALGDVGEVERLLVGGAGAHFTVIPDNEAILTGLQKAAGKGFLNVVASIIKFRPTLINQKIQDKTVLMIAAYEGEVSLLSWLLANGGDGSIADGAGDIPIHYAAIGDKPLAILTLADKGSPVNCQNGEKRTALHLSVINGNMETVRALLKVGASANIQDRNGETPLHIAINSGSDDIAALLIGHADLLVCEQAGCNPLHLAVKRGNLGLVLRLLQEDRGIINIVTREGLAPLHLAARGSAVIVDQLLQVPECDVDIQDRLGRTALHYAAADFNITLLSTLIKRRVKVDMQDNDGNTAAHLAAAGPPRHPENPYSNELEDIFNRQHMDRLAYLQLDPARIIQVAALLLLLKHGNRDLTNCDGETPTDIIENDELLRFIDDYLSRPPGPAAAAGSEHDYAEIPEELARGPPESEYVAAAGSSAGGECRVCSETTNLVTFHPCQHKVVCSGCAARMKKCLECQNPVEKKIISPSNLEPADDKERGRLRSLEQKVQDLEEQFLCGICMERRRNVAFLCGHGACTLCTQGLVNCHMCRVKIERKIPLY